jgi:hypothetical protein
MRGLPANSSCMFLSPTQLWGNNMVDFLSDPDIPDTILGDSSNPTLRGLPIDTLLFAFLLLSTLVDILQLLLISVSRDHDEN